MAIDFAAAETKERISAFVRRGEVSRRVIDLLLHQGQLVPQETELWDYKRELPDFDCSVDAAELVKDVVAFSNSLGGYLLFGVMPRSQDGESLEAVGVGGQSFDTERLRNVIRNFVGDLIPTTFGLVDLPELNCLKLGLLHVPPRPVGLPPLKFQRNSPESSKGKYVFRAGDVYFRFGDECRPAKDSHDWQFLYKEREILLDSREPVKRNRVQNSLQHNLPSRAVICPQFVGRDEILSRLWDWIGDEFQYARVLAGDGGKGKTSIAYEFATQVAKTAPRDVEQVIWLTAKQKQFKALDNDWVELPETHYSDLESLLREVASRVALIDSEIDGLSASALKGKVKEALDRFPAFVVVDDVDSLDPDEQKRLLEAANVIGNPKSRFLLTTRANTSYSADLCITVPGLPKKEYLELLNSLCERLSVDLPKNAPEQLHAATEGSPLLTESILRLVLRGEPLHRAIDEWRGQAGSDARAAALKKEIDRLSSESRRALLALAYFGECSSSELRQALEYAPASVQKCIEELNSLFLLQARRVTEDEPRFSISNTARIVVIERAKELARDHVALSNRIRTLRTPGLGSSGQGNRQRIGAAIAQANAKLRDRDPTAAIAAVRAEMGRQGDHPDLLTMLGCCLAQASPAQRDEARVAFRRALERSAAPKAVLFEKWYVSGNPAVSSLTAMLMM